MTPKPRQFEVLQQWEGVIVEADKDTISCELTDMTDRTKPNECCTFSIKEISLHDRELVRPGAVFYWHIGYETRSGQISRVSEIRMKRNPRWTQRMIDEAKTKAAEYLQDMD